MSIETRTGIRYEYKCNICSIDYSEQRYPTESQFFTTCQKFGCGGVYELVSQTEFTFEQYIPDPVVVEPVISEE